MSQRIMVLLGGLLVLLGLVTFLWVRSLGDQMAPPPQGIDFAEVRDPLWPAPQFDLTDADGQDFSSLRLKGKVWLASFIFTRCPGPCPLITKRMSEVQEATSDLDDFRLVSISVDPAFDQPAVLKAYAGEWGADAGRWHFLTGDSGIVNGVVRQFKIASYQQPTDQDMDPQGVPDITHGTNMLLVDRNGQVRAVLSSEDPDFLQKALKGIEQLRNGG